MLFTLLLASGAGSWLTSIPAVARRGLICLISLLGVLALTGILTHPIIAALQSRSTPARVGAAMALLAPMGLFLGMAFPLGLKAARGRAPGLSPWLWGVNGAASVCASVLAVVLSMSFGISATYWIGAACYCAAALAFRRALPSAS